MMDCLYVKASSAQNGLSDGHSDTLSLSTSWPSVPFLPGPIAVSQQSYNSVTNGVSLVLNFRGLDWNSFIGDCCKLHIICFLTTSTSNRNDRPNHKASVTGLLIPHHGPASEPSSVCFSLWAGAFWVTWFISLLTTFKCTLCCHRRQRGKLGFILWDVDSRFRNSKCALQETS